MVPLAAGRDYHPKHSAKRRAQWADHRRKKLASLTPEQIAANKLAKAAYDKLYREKHRDKRRDYKREPSRLIRWNKLRNQRYRERHPSPVWQTPEQRLEKRRAAGRAAQKKRRSKTREHNKARRHRDPAYRLTINMRRRVHDMLSKGLKSAATFELVGCTPKQLKEYLESLFTAGMSWENYAYYGWHVDHKTPLAAYDMTDPAQQRIAFHYSNLQPLWWRDNLTKNAKLPAQLFASVRA